MVKLTKPEYAPSTIDIDWDKDYSLAELIKLILNHGNAKPVRGAIVGVTQALQELLYAKSDPGELDDIRTGNNGVVYDTPGDAVRQQILTLQELLTGTETTGPNLLKNAALKQGYFDLHGFSSSADWQSLDLTPVPENVTTVTAYADSKSYITFYSASQGFMKSIAFVGNTSTMQPVAIPYDAKYVTVSALNSAIKNLSVAWVLPQANTATGKNVIDMTVMKQGFYDVKGFNSDEKWRCSTSMVTIPDGITTATAYADSESYVSFYNSGKEFIISTPFQYPAFTMQPVAIPTDAKFATVSMIRDAAVYFTLAWGNTGTKVQLIKPQSINRSLWMPSKSLIVDPGGNGDFTKVQDAITAADDGATISIMPGDYYESVDAKDKRVNLVGYSSSTTRIISTDDRRDYPALEMTSGSASNISFISQRPTGAADPDYLTPYGAHLDYDGSAHQSLTFENCAFRSDWNAGVGIGMRIGENLYFKDCSFTSTPSISMGAVFFHDCSKAEFAGDYSLTFDNCNLWAAGNYSFVALGIAHPGNKMDLTLIRNSFYSGVHGTGDDGIGKQEATEQYPASDGDEFMGTATIVLNPRSFGNSAPKCNAAES